jgi:hypothetical protein
MFAALLLVVAGGVLLVAGTTELGAWVLAIGIVLLALIPWVGVLLGVVHEPDDSDADRWVRNSDAGFVLGLVKGEGRVRKDEEPVG